MPYHYEMTSDRKIALFADIHSNLEALDACLEHAHDQGVTEFVFLGDLVGYNADPVAVIEKISSLVKANKAIAIMGNHDEAIFTDHSNRMNSSAWEAIQWTRNQLSANHIEFLKNLPLIHKDEDICYVHASAANPQNWNYVDGGMAAWHCAEAAETIYTFLGHVHEATVYYQSTVGKLMRFHPQAGEPVPMSRHRRWVTIAGSLGQPRDGNPAANYAIFDPDEEAITFHRIDYDNYKAAEKVRKAGLPEELATRLLTGK
jgi:diadenosine tetraphosphatase ApaH/serine/threonine PP2A family protein phosphatase